MGRCKKHNQKSLDSESMKPHSWFPIRSGFAPIIKKPQCCKPEMPLFHYESKKPKCYEPEKPLLCWLIPSRCEPVVQSPDSIDRQWMPPPIAFGVVQPKCEKCGGNHPTILDCAVWKTENG